jgi:hypothetical protein
MFKPSGVKQASEIELSLLDKSGRFLQQIL